MNEIQQTNEQRIMADLTMIFVRLDEIKALINNIANNKTPQQTTFQPPAPRTQYPAVCSLCGQNCTVPFKVNAGSRVKCMDCYTRQKNGQ